MPDTKKKGTSMKIAGIIAEYNPFHNGHLYHLEQTRRITGADYVIVIMSGNFTQRGEPALLDKYLRTKMALSCGADLVLELPACCACASAQYFSDGAVSILEHLGVTDFLVFGSEAGDISMLLEAADILLKQPADYRCALQDNLRSGLSFPAARAKALSVSHAELLSSPNNILGIEYCRSLLSRGSAIKPITVTRTGSAYQNDFLEQTFSSALAIRTALKKGDTPSLLSLHLPASAFTILKSAIGKTAPIFPEMLSDALHYKLLSESSEGFTRYLDVSGDLSNRICRQLPTYTGYEDFCMSLKTKELTLTRISRSLAHILLTIEKDTLELCRMMDFAPYARILGFRREAAPLLSAIRSNASIPLISKLADARRYLPAPALMLLEKDILAAHIYNSLVLHRYHTHLPHEMQRQIIISDESLL